MLDRIKERLASQSAPSHTIPIYQAAIEGQEASFPLLLKLRRHIKRAEREKADEALRESLGWYYRRAHHTFQRANGRITEMYLGDDGSAIALTDRHRFFSNYRINSDSKVDRLLLECDRMSTEACRLLQGRDLQACTQVLYAAAKTLLSIKSAAPPACEDEHSKCIQVVENHLAYARDYHERAARESAERAYSSGMLLGILAGVLAFLLLRLFLPELRMPAALQSEALSASLLAGGMGAIVSVMWRMINGNLTVRYKVDRWTLVLVGLFRPFIGAVFGLLVFALIQSDLLPIEVVADEVRAIYFFGVIGFLAGFSERWAPDLLQTTENGFNAAAGSSGPPPGGDAAAANSAAADGRAPVNGNGHAAATVG